MQTSDIITWGIVIFLGYEYYICAKQLQSYAPEDVIPCILGQKPKKT